MAFWNRMRERVGWDRDFDQERDRWSEWRRDYRGDYGRGGYGPYYDRDYDRGFSPRWGRSAPYERARDYGRAGYGGEYGRGSYEGIGRGGYPDYGYDRDRWSSRPYNQGSFDDYDRYDVWHDRGRRSTADFDYERGPGYPAMRDWDRNRNRW